MDVFIFQTNRKRLSKKTFLFFLRFIENRKSVNEGYG